jgi:sec-independent protein translocase protein TatA
MFDKIGALQLVIILVIVVMIFGVGKLPQAAGSLGKAIKEFKKESSNTEETDDDDVEEVAPRRKRAATTTRKARTTKAVKAKETEV